MPRNVGILGGSFDPIHAGHLAIAEAALQTFGLDEVRFLPCAQQALKSRKPSAGDRRCAWIRQAIAGNARFTLDCRELVRSGKIYTFDTLCELKRELPQAKLWFICGMDSVRDFPKWHRPQEVLDLCEIIAFDRPGVEVPKPPFDPRLLSHHLRGPLIDLSSTQIRAAQAALSL